MFELSNTWFALELLAAEAIFLYSAPKRSHFAWRYVIMVVACLGLAYLFPVPSQLRFNNWYYLVRFLVIFGLTVAGNFLCFNVKFHNLFGACVSGYATQHILYHCGVLLGKSNLLHDFAIQGVLSRSNLLELILLVPVYLLIFFTFGKFAAKNKVYRKFNVWYFVITIILVFVCVGYTRIATALRERNLVTVSLYAITTCLSALFTQIYMKKVGELQTSKKALEVLISESKKQYQISKENVEMLNIKYHDLMHRINSFGDRLSDEEKESVRQVLDDYGAVAHTGSEAIDVLLAQNRHRCKQLGIELNYYGNANELSFLSPDDVYSLFGNVLDNAIDAVSEIVDVQKRIIEIVVERRGDLVYCSASNYFEGELKMSDGLPRTTKRGKSGFHGYGMKSIRLIVQKYGGSAEVSVENNIFTLVFYLVSPHQNSPESK